MKTTRNFLRATLASLAVCTLGLTASGQSTSPAAESADDVVKLANFTVFGDRIDIVNVATRLPLTDLETPQTISLIDSARLERESMFSMDDVMRNVTGVNVSLYDTQRPLYFSRGFQITDFQVDGIPTFSTDTNQEYDTALYERVEILRGANGLFSGSGEPSGTINFIRKAPTKDFAASVFATVGSWDYYRGQIDVNTPLTADGRVRSRFVASYTDRDSFRDRYHEEKTAFLASVAADLTADTTLTVGYQKQDNEPTASVWGTIPPLAIDGTPSNLPRHTNFATNWAYWQRESGTFFTNLQHKFAADWQLTAAFNHTEGAEESKSVYANPYAGSFLDKSDGSGVIISGYYWESEDERDSVDLYLNGTFPAFGRDHDLVVGASYSDYAANYPNHNRTFAFAPWNYEIPNFYTWDGSAPEMAVTMLPGSNHVANEQLGFYSSLRLRLTEEFSALLGGRVTRWQTEDFDRDGSGGTTVNSAFEIDHEFTPYVGFTYDFPAGFTAYASYTKIFEPQTYLGVNDHYLDPLDGYNLEAGVKARFAQDRATFTAAVFQTGQDNYAVVHPDYANSPDPRYVGVDGTETQGVEFQLSGLVTRDWSVIFGYTYNDTNRHTGDLIYANLPDHLVQLSTHYQFPGAWSRLAVGAGLTWQSEITGTLALPTGDIAATHQDAYALVNLHVNYQINEHLGVTLSAKNALDETYLANLDYPNYGEPRNLLLTLAYKF
ncbi:TonB-dependent siderophore receptor [Synoicihabitans lomoniglobus]|uniref:TonB-dependent siderophore receptor n=1 Tax=Synoicihabitans lomoniglobus TaxID=2909285 RepID=A0AAE9ZY57_9BACT|nr:TonB-dependent siderophore receptor [Opitutaceae bacterium LMO-M01]WED65499.1 TonB-dependent siderophore receptor [Opitutaceae bacterium LMO-M01]